jgi:hypothetical protein
VYDVVVGSPSGSLTSSGCTVSVTSWVSGQPVILGHPKNSMVSPYQSASVSATVGSEGPFRYQWYLNSLPLSGGGASGTAKGGTPLTFTYGVGSVVDKDQGLYHLVATGANGVDVESRPGALLLTISFGETRLLVKGWTTDLSVFLNDTNQGVDRSTGVRYGFVDLPPAVPKFDTLLVSVNTSGKPTYTWHYRAVNGQITTIPSHTNQPYARLRMAEADVPKKKGAYVLTIRTVNPVGARAIYFNVMTFANGGGGEQFGAPPNFVRQPRSLLVPEGGAANFGVEVDGMIAYYGWLRRNVAGVRGLLPWAPSSPWLTIDAAATGDSGSYWVEVIDFFNRTGVSTEAELHVLPAGD